MRTMNGQGSTNEILEAINAASSATQEQFESLEKKFESLEKNISREIKQAEHKLMDHVDRRVADLEGVFVASLRKEDNKVNIILEILEENKLARPDQIKRARSIHIFPRAPEIS